MIAYGKLASGTHLGVSARIPDPMRPVRVMIASSDRATREELAATCRELGHAVIECDEPSAVRALLAGVGAFDAIVLDARHGELRSMALVAEIRAADRSSPIVVLTEAGAATADEVATLGGASAVLDGAVPSRQISDLLFPGPGPDLAR